MVNKSNLIGELFLALLLLLSLIMAGAFTYQRIEGWNLIDSAYFATMTITTIGYGDLAPHTMHGKLFTIGYSLAGIGVALYVLTIIGRFIIEDIVERRINNGVIRKFETYLRKKRRK